MLKSGKLSSIELIEACTELGRSELELVVGSLT
jgi:hypothetical protein